MAKTTNTARHITAMLEAHGARPDTDWAQLVWGRQRP